jgi:phage terminase large subunit-like protein
MTFDPAPRFATQRNPSRATLGGQVAKVFAMMGEPPMPWQRQALDVACEIDPATGLYWYRTVIIIVLRQAGKTTLSRGKLAHRALSHPYAKMLYTAQDRNKALKRLRESIYEPLSRSPHPMISQSLAKPRWAAGSEMVRWRNGSQLTIDAVSKTSGHGDTLDEAHIDEAFAHRDARIDANVSPTMITVKGAQKWITSAAGEFESHYLRSKLELGRALVQSGQESRTCYIEYSADPDLDPDDPATYLCHPALGHTIRLEDIIDERTNMDADEFERAYLGWWPKAKAPDPPISLEAWESNYADPKDPAGLWLGTPIWSVDVSPDREWTSIGLAAESTDPRRRCFLEVIERQDGTEHAVERLRQLREEHGGDRVALDATGAASSLAQDLEDEGFEVVRMNSRERVEACGGLADDALYSRLRFLDDQLLTDAMKSAAKLRISGGDAWIFSRGKSLADISPLYAAVIARWAFARFRPSTYTIGDSLA